MGGNARSSQLRSRGQECQFQVLDTEEKRHCHGEGRARQGMVRPRQHDNGEDNIQPARHSF